MRDIKYLPELNCREATGRLKRESLPPSKLYGRNAKTSEADVQSRPLRGGRDLS